MTPIENIDYLESFWRRVNTAPAGIFDGSDPLGLLDLIPAAAKANNAMDELVNQASTNDHVRALFAQRNVFTSALFSEAPSGRTDKLFGRYGSVETAITGWRVPRLVMLDGIKKSSVGGFISATDPAGFTRWIGSVAQGAVALQRTLVADPNGQVRIAAMDCLLNVAIPVVWAELFLKAGTLDDLEAQLPFTKFSDDAAIQLKTTTQLANGVVELRGRMTVIRAIVESSKFKLPAFATGDGALAMTAPGAPRAWYKRGELWGTVAGLTLGAVASAKLNKRVNRS